MALTTSYKDTMKFKWATFKVADMEKSLHFYKELLGLNIAMELGTPEHRIIMLGNPQETMIELICAPNAAINIGNGVSIGLEIDDMEAQLLKLRENGCAISPPMSPNPQMRFYFVQDPDGYTIQLVEML